MQDAPAIEPGRWEHLFREQQALLELLARGRPLDECLRAMTSAISRLAPGARAYFLRADREHEAVAALDRPEGPLGCHSEPVSGSGGQPLATIVLCFDSARGPTEWERRLASFGARVAGIAIERDRAAESARRSHERLGELLATMSQELRAPLDAIVGWTTLLRRDGYDPKRLPRALATIERNAMAQVRTIDEILDVSGIISGKLRLHMRLVDVEAVAGGALDAVRQAAADKGVQLTSAVAADAGAVVADGERLRQVLCTLLVDAIKVTPRGRSVSLSVVREESSVHFVVCDSGEGIVGERLPFLVERFRQADPSTSREYGGLGLGLAVTLHTIELHGGTITAESRGTGLGSVVTVTLPQCAVYPSQTALPGDANEHGDAAPALPDEKGAPSLAGLTVLIVDDEADSRGFLTHALERLGATVLAADSARDALAAVERHPVDVLVSDIGMPEEDGFSLIERVRSLPPTRGGQVPAVALTAYAGGEHAARALSVGYQRHMPKPTDVDALVEVVASLARGVRA